MDEAGAAVRSGGLASRPSVAPSKGGELELSFRLPIEGWPRAVFRSSYTLRGGTLDIAEESVLAARDAEELALGVEQVFRGVQVRLHARRAQDGKPEVEVTAGGARAIREDTLRATTSRSAWIHGFVALAASFFGFAASALYLVRAETAGDPWALKMAIHMAAWHALLTLVLFPLSVWGQRAGIRAVQAVSALFFAIHLGISLANTHTSDGLAIAVLNAASGLCFLAAVVYGQVAHRDMDPTRELSALTAA